MHLKKQNPENKTISFTLRIPMETREKLELLSHNNYHRYNCSAVMRELIAEAYFKQFELNKNTNH
jgi:hypothetical protein